eukprot:TRINITY_DN38832_c0_g2_i2.p1 TRINITY_DN38832_c0_g2~~TRINITY_DN38832_c0_g2_i2.p1  ORF type:complete len:109 (+),score=6.47 TRINITY_DN38832_c0_g2_i2:173-499(+)
METATNKTYITCNAHIHARKEALIITYILDYSTCNVHMHPQMRALITDIQTYKQVHGIEIYLIHPSTVVVQSLTLAHITGHSQLVVVSGQKRREVEQQNVCTTFQIIQ